MTMAWKLLEKEVGAELGLELDLYQCMSDMTCFYPT